MSAPLQRTAAVLAAGALALGLAGCSALAGGGGEAVTDWGTATPAAEPADDATGPGPLDALLPAPEELPGGGWQLDAAGAQREQGADVPEATCLLDVTPALSPEEYATESGRGYLVDGRDDYLMVYVYEVAAAEQLGATLAAELAACSGGYEGRDDQGTYTITMSPSAVVVPGAAAGVCRTHEIAFDDGVTTLGTFCLAATGNHMVTVIDIAQDGGQLDAAEMTAVLAAATTRAFAPA